MCVSLSTYQPRGDAEPMIGLAERPARFDGPLGPVAAAAEGCDGPAATGVMPAGVRV
jgi:hypothetical protein